MNLRLFHSGLLQTLRGIDPTASSVPFWQLPLKPQWADRVEPSPRLSLTQLAVVGWIIGFTGAVLFHLAWPGVTPFRKDPGATAAYPAARAGL